jgi:hypothetical protein
MLALAVELLVAVPLSALWGYHGAKMIERKRSAKRRAVSRPRPMSHGPVIPR